MMILLTLVSAALLSLVDANPVVSKRQSTKNYIGSDTQNQLFDGTPCQGITIIFARGTFESGNVGALTGPPFFQAVSNLAKGNVAVQGVEYPADVFGFIAGGDSNGSQKMADLVTTAAQKCPETHIVLSGYSQGGQLVHKAGKSLNQSMMGKLVSSAVIFGDPDRGQPVESVPPERTLVICHAGDNICDGGVLITPAHLDYAVDAQTAAEFVVRAAGM